MTKERLIEAITAFAPDPDTVVERIKAAAGEDKLYCAWPGKCLLAEAWRKPGKLISVGVVSFGEGTNEREMLISSKNHTFKDVVIWFDDMWTTSTRSARANAEVVRLLS